MWGKRDRVLIDVDGVLADFVGHTLTELHRLGGPKLTREDWTVWDGLSIMPERFQRAVTEAWREELFCATIPEYKGAWQGVDALRRILPVHFVTAPLPKSKFWYQERHDWLVDRFQAREKGDITFTHNKEHVHGTVLIDDKPEHVVEWQEEHPYGVAILFSQPYNQPIPGILRTNDWDEIVEVVKNLEGL